MAFLSHRLSQRPVDTTRWLEPLSCRQNRQNSYPSADIGKISNIVVQNLEPITTVEKLLPLRKILRDPTIRQDVIDLFKNNIPVQIIRSVPKKILGMGQDGNVYEVQDEEGLPIVLKIYEPYLYSKHSGNPMQGSFALCNSMAKVLSILPACPHLLKFQGVAFVEELEQWGVLYEKIEGITFHLNRIKEKPAEERKSAALNVARGVAQALQILDYAEWPHADVDYKNIMIRTDGTPVLIDFPHHPASNPATSKKLFGELFLQLFLNITPCLEHIRVFFHSGCDLKELIFGLPEDLTNLLTDCVDAQCNEKTSWQQIRDADCLDATAVKNMSWQPIIDVLNQVMFPKSKNMKKEVRIPDPGVEIPITYKTFIWVDGKKVEVEES